MGLDSSQKPASQASSKPVPEYSAYKGVQGWFGRKVRQFVEGQLGFFIKYASPSLNVVEELDRRAVLQSCDFIEKNMPDALALRTREDIWALSVRSAAADGLFLEFGVLDAYSTNWFAKYRAGRVYGFDSFEGLQQDWSATLAPKGMFDRRGRLPRVRANVTLVKGWFADTLPGFLAEHREPISFIHIDCDVYEPAKFVLETCRAQIRAGTLILFDEYHGFRGWELGEHRALTEFTQVHGIEFEYVAFNRYCCLVRITGIP
jgi:hypothetical protein